MRDREPLTIPADILDLETVRLYPPSPEEDPAKMPPPAAWRVVVAGMCRLRWDSVAQAPKVEIASRWSDAERPLIEHLVKVISDRAVLVTFNGRRFDVPVVLGACMRHSIPWPWFFGTPGVRVRWNTHGHIDLCDELSDHGAATMMGLDTWGLVTGLGRKTDSGTSVADLWEQSPRAVAEYCAGDVRLTASLYIRWLVVSGAMSHERADAFHEAIWGAPASASELVEA